MSDLAQFIEVLSVAQVRTDQEQRAVVVTVRPQPDRSWAFHHLGLTIQQAERLRDDLTALLKTPATFLVLAALALASGGCAARVEVATERSTAAEAQSVSAPPTAASEKHRTTVEVGFLEQPQPEPAARPVANEEPVATTQPVPNDQGGIQVNGSKNRIEFHYHRHRRSHASVLIHPIVRHEMVIVPTDGSAPVVFMDNAPPRVAVVDKEVARAYAKHMLRLAQREGLR